MTMQGTGAGRCLVSADANNPLVTEWSASEKAHLEGLLSNQIVAVEYSGCELRIIPGCTLAGSYAWHETTLATDTVSIDSVDELYAKIPIGAAALEADLARSDYLAVRTTVSGQLRVDRQDVEVPKTGACAAATHWVSALSVGAFKLFSGQSTGSRVSVEGTLGTGRVEDHNEQIVLREAGSREACASASATAPNPQCASPVQIFLKPVGLEEQYEQTAKARRSGAVQLSLAAPEDTEESWTLRDRSGNVLCATPCQYLVPPSSGFYLTRSAAKAEDRIRLDLPESFAFQPGSDLEVTYRAERGAPLTSKIFFLGLGVPLIIGGVFFSSLTVGSYVGDCDAECQDDRGLLVPLGLSYLVAAGGLYYWYSWSHEQGLEVNSGGEDDSTASSLHLGPGYLRGSF